jgi:hypothetical protein
MRFSLKWLLAVMAYVALAVVALDSQQPYLGYALWLATLGTIVYALTLAFLADGARKGMAIGFVASAICYALGMQLAGVYMPSLHVAHDVFGTSKVQPVKRSSFILRTGDPNFERRREESERLSLIREWHNSTGAAAHATGVMLAGMIGAALGALAARHASVGADRE